MPMTKHPSRILLGLLLALPLVSGEELNIQKCISAFRRSDKNNNGILEHSEFVQYCKTEAHKTPMQLFVREDQLNNIFAAHQEDSVPKELQKIYDHLEKKTQELRGDTNEGISISGAKHFQKATSQEKAVLEILCEDTSDAIAKLLEFGAETRTGKDDKETRQGAVSTNQKPNIIVMQPDDMPFFDAWTPPPNNPAQANLKVNFPAAGLPNMEKLRTGGVQMMQAYTASPMCGTSRFSTMTGRYPSRSSASRQRSIKNEEDVQTVDIPATKLSDEDCSTENVAAAFQTGGYRTGMMGKWHLSSIRDDSYTYEGAVETVQGCGFDTVAGLYIENLAAKEAEFDNYSDGTFSHNMEWITHEAIDFINEASDADEPFFLYFNPTVSIYSSLPLCIHMRAVSFY